MASANSNSFNCPRCHVGIDDNGDGDCLFCVKFSDEQLRQALIQGLNMYSRPGERCPTDREEAGKPQVRWTRLLCFQGSENQLAWHKQQSVFQTTRTMGNVTCLVLEDAEVDAETVVMINAVVAHVFPLVEDLHPKETT